MSARRKPGKSTNTLPIAPRGDFNLVAGATFFFIDGSHTYSYVRSDTENCFKLCGGKGVFLWHDGDDEHPGIVQLITEWRQQGRDIVRIAGPHPAYWKAP